MPSTYFGTAVIVLKDPLTSAALTKLYIDVSTLGDYACVHVRVAVHARLT